MRLPDRRRVAALTLQTTFALALIAAPLAAGDLHVDGSFVSTVPTGTPPLAVSSTSRVEGLNADLLDGLDSSDLFTAATDGSGSGLDADLLDGLDRSSFARSLGNVFLVAKAGGDFSSIQAALDSITTASETNPYLVLVGPGVYDEQVTLKPFVDIQGSGEGVSRIRRLGTDYPPRTVIGADDAELRFLTVEQLGGADGGIGVYNFGVSPRLVHVTVTVEATAGSVTGIYNESTAGSPSRPELDHVRVEVSAPLETVGIGSYTEANTRMRDVEVRAHGGGGGLGTWGVNISGASPLLEDVDLFVESPGRVFGVVAHLAPGAVLRRVRMEVSGAGDQYGMWTFLSNLTLRELEVLATGDGDDSYGIYHEGGEVVLEASSIRVAGGSDPGSLTAGVVNEEGSTAIRDSTVVVEGGAGSEYGVQGVGAGGGPRALDVEHSRLSGGDGAILAPAGFAVRVGASQLEGGVSGGGSFTCVHSYDGSFAVLACP